MPHQCVRCNLLYPDGAKEILQGCPCGAKLFFYISKQKLEKLQATHEEIKLDEKDREQIEKDVRELVGDQFQENDPVVLDIESIRIKKPGQYEIDLVHLFKGDPIVFKLEEGKYMIDLIEIFNSFKHKKQVDSKQKRKLRINKK